MKDIMMKYTNGEITLEEANEQLKPYGISLKERTKEELEAKRAAEREGEFLDIGKDPLNLPDEPDMSRRPELAGLTVIKMTKAGAYAVSYDENGYAAVSKRVELL
jgi:hypothetical protein